MLNVLLSHKMSSLGSMNFSNGKKYVGGFDRARKHGQGTYWTAEGEVYEGSWIHDKKVGHFKITCGDSGKLLYEGDISAYKR